MQREFRRLSKQKGMSSIAWVAVLALVGVFALTALKLIPVYIEYYTIVRILDDIKVQPALKDKGKVEILNALGRRLSIESNISNLNNDTYSVEKVKGKNRYMIKVEYEVRKPLLGNVSVVASFQRSVEVGE